MLSRVRSIVVRAGGAALAGLFPADCFLCGSFLPWRQDGGACRACWERIAWTPGLRAGGSPLRTLLWAAEYSGAVRRLIHGLKFEEMDWLGPLLGGRVARHLGPLLSLPRLRPDAVVPVPLHFWRRARRGYNQAALLARPIARSLGTPLAAGLLARPRAGRRQLGLTRSERRVALDGCYRASSAARGLRILLVDDVATTGATLEACARALLRAGAASVAGVVVARTPFRD